MPYWNYLLHSLIIANDYIRYWLSTYKRFLIALRMFCGETMLKSGAKIIVVVMLIAAFGMCNVSANESDKYTFHNYGGEAFTPEPMQFGDNIRNQVQNGLMEATTDQKNKIQRKHILFQFYAAPTEEQLELLAEYGVQRAGIGGPHTLIVSMPAELTPADLPAESGLRWMGEIPIENKYDNNFASNVPEWAKMEDGKVEVWISFYDDVSYEEAQIVANKYSTETPNFHLYPYLFDLKIKTKKSNIPLIANEDIVREVAYLDGELEDEDAKQSPAFQSIIGVFAFVFISSYLRSRRRV